MKQNGSHTYKFTSHPCKYLTAHIFFVFSLVLWLATSLGFVSEVVVLCVFLAVGATFMFRL